MECVTNSCVPLAGAARVFEGVYDGAPNVVSGMLSTGISIELQVIVLFVLQCVVVCCSALQCIASGMLSTGVSIE